MTEYHTYDARTAAEVERADIRRLRTVRVHSTCRLQDAERWLDSCCCAIAIDVHGREETPYCTVM